MNRRRVGLSALVPRAPLASGETRWPSANETTERNTRRRVALGAQRGLSRSAARGHPRAGERAKPATQRSIDPGGREELALKMMRRGRSLRDAASHYHISQERLRAYVKETDGSAGAKAANGQSSTGASRQFPFYSNGRVVTPTMSLDETAKAGRYMQAVKQFLRTGDDRFLTPFAGKGVRDIEWQVPPIRTRRKHPLRTRSSRRSGDPRALPDQRKDCVMTPLERDLHRAAVKNKKERLAGIHNEVCIGCGRDLALGKEDDHMVGRKHGDLVWPLCAPNIVITSAPSFSAKSRLRPPIRAMLLRSLGDGSCRSPNILS